MGCVGFSNDLPAGFRFRPSDEELMKYYLGNKVLGRPVPGQGVKNISENELYNYHPSTIVNLATKDDPFPERDEREWYFFVRYIKKQEKKQPQEEEINKNCNTCHQENRAIIEEEKENVRAVGDGIGFRKSTRKHRENKATIDEEKENIRAVGDGIGFRKSTRRHVEDKAIIDGEKENVNVRTVGNAIGFWKSTGKEDHIRDVDGKVYAFKIHFTYYKGKGKKTHWTMDEYHLISSSKRLNQKNHKTDEWVLIKIKRGQDYTGFY